MKRITLLALLLSVFALMGAQDWTEITIPNADFTDSTTVGNIPANWVAEVGANAARAEATVDGVTRWAGVTGYTGGGTTAIGFVMNFIGATIPDEPVDYKLTVDSRTSYTNKSKVDSFLFVMRISAWELGTDSTLRTVIDTCSKWVTSGIWDSSECLVSLDAASLADLSGKQLVLEFGIHPIATKGGEPVGAAAAWLQFTSPKLEYKMEQTSSLHVADVANAKVFVLQNVLNIQDNIAQQTDLKLYDTAGKIIKQHNFNTSNVSISLDGVKSGIYLVTLKNQQGVQTHKVFVK